MAQHSMCPLGRIVQGGTHNIECYDPAAGTGTLLMALAHQIGEDRCTIFAQDRSQKSNKMLKLNLILMVWFPRLTMQSKEIL